MKEEYILISNKIDRDQYEYPIKKKNKYLK